MSDPAPLATHGHAWSTVPRREVPTRHPTDRITDFQEVYIGYDEATAREQASRCIQCPNPACVTGCPLQLQIPEWLGLVADGQFADAAARLQAMGTMPEICARVCAADRLCEALCIIGDRTAPVAIWALEQFLNNYAFAHGVANATVESPGEWRVAVVGATLGGIACASELARRGLLVTLMDHASIGDALAREAPGFRLEARIAERRLTMLVHQGVEFRAGALLGRTELEARFDSVYLAYNASHPRRLDIPGIGLAGVAQALPFIAHYAAPVGSASAAHQVRGKRVLVIGCGDTAIDCARTALRAGARQVIGVYRRREEAMPCSRREYENALEEGVVYVFGAMPIAVLGNEDGEVSAVRFGKTANHADSTSREAPVAVQPGSEFEIAADRVFLAIGCEGRCPSASDPFNELCDAAGLIHVDENHMTSVPGVFAGGELVRGPCLPLEAVRDARRAAPAIERHLAARRAQPPAATERATR